MMELMSDLALELNESRRRELALDAMRASRQSRFGIRRTAGTLMVAVGEWLIGARLVDSRSKQTFSAAVAPLQRNSG